MSNELRYHAAYANDDIVQWVIAQIEATTEPGSLLPEWMIGAFEGAMLLEDSVAEAEAGAAVGGEDREGNEEKQDDVFNFELVYFKIEKTTFTVIKDWLMVEGSIFQDMFVLPATGTMRAAVEGARATNPIILEQTSAADFKAFLNLLYGSRGQPLQTYDEWVGALELAMRWNFTQIQKEAMAGLNLLLPSLGPLARIHLARRFSVGPWLRTGLISLVTDVIEHKSKQIDLFDEEEFPLDMASIAKVSFACFELASANHGATSLVKEYCEECESDRSRHGLRACRPCEILRAINAEIRKDIQRMVDEVFGSEIAGCVYTEEL